MTSRISTEGVSIRGLLSGFSCQKPSILFSNNIEQSKKIVCDPTIQVNSSELSAKWILASAVVFKKLFSQKRLPKLNILKEVQSKRKDKEQKHFIVKSKKRSVSLN